MASSPFTSWQIDGETTETVKDFIFLGSKITADGECSHEIKRHLLLGRKAMTKLESILKSRDITLPTKVNLVKAMVFPVVIYGCELDHNVIWAPNNWCFFSIKRKKKPWSEMYHLRWIQQGGQQQSYEVSRRRPVFPLPSQLRQAHKIVPAWSSLLPDRISFLKQTFTSW